jgi:SAM-dependent methyltransferase
VKRLLLQYLACPCCQGALAPDSDADGDLERGQLVCGDCQAGFPIQRGIPILLVGDKPKDEATSRLYSDIYRHCDRPEGEPPRPAPGYQAEARDHFEVLRLASGWEPVEPGIGLDAGCGCAGMALGVAAGHPESHVVGIDLSEGPLTAAHELAGCGNADLVRGDLMAPPFVESAFDFVYSFGVLHHTPDPRRAFHLLIRRLRPGGRITIFVYKDFSDLPLKRFVLRQVNRLRRITTRMPPRGLRTLCRLAAPLVFVSLTLPAQLLRRIGCGRFARHIPYGVFPTLASVAGSLEDRFGAPYEFRYSAADLRAWAEGESLTEARVVDCLPWGFSGLVLAGRRPA